MATRVLLLTQWFDPEPTFKGIVFARELVASGFAVEVVTGFPNYPGGKLYPGYRIKWIQREIIDGVEVTRVPLYPNHDQSAVKRALNYLSFSLASFVYGCFFAKRPDVIYAYHPPLTVGVTAVLLRFFRRIPVVYDIQDMWPDTLRATGMVRNERALSLVGKLCRWVYRHVDRIVVLSPGFMRLLTERGVPEQKIDVIFNWCNEAALSAPVGTVPEEFSDESHFTILFAGNMGKAQAMDEVLRAAGLLLERAPEVRFVLLGGGVEVERLKRVALDSNLGNVRFIKQVPMEQVGGLLAASDALLVHLKKDPLFEITIPSKTQAYMSVGKPILMAVDGDAAHLITASGCGVTAESGNAESIAMAALKLARSSSSELRAMGAAGRDYYMRNLSLSVGVAQFSSIFHASASAASRRQRSA